MEVAKVQTSVFVFVESKCFQSFCLIIFKFVHLYTPDFNGFNRIDGAAVPLGLFITSTEP